MGLPRRSLSRENCQLQILHRHEQGGNAPGRLLGICMRGTARAGLELAFPSPPPFLSFFPPVKKWEQKKQNTSKC